MLHRVQILVWARSLAWLENIMAQRIISLD